MDIQPGDVAKTWADVEGLIKDYDYQPNTPVKQGISDFVKWYKDFYQIDF
jgi:UDP-glucuronate 4-epimerase